MEKKVVYPKVEIFLNLLRETNQQELIVNTKMRFRHRGKYYLSNYHRKFILDIRCQGLSLLDHMAHCYEEIFLYLKLTKVNLKMVNGHYDPPKPIFELDLDQISEEERLLPESNYDPNRYTKR